MKRMKPRINFIEDENGGFLTNILNMWKNYFFWLLYVQC